MTGEAEFNEVYFTDTRIPDSETPRQAVGDGWRVSLTTLMNERVSIGGSIPQTRLGRHQPAASRRGRQLPAERKDAAELDEVMKLWVRAEVLRLTNIRANQNRKMGDPGPEGSIGKMASADLNKDVYGQDDRPDGRRRAALRQLRDGPSRGRRAASRRCRRRSCAAGPTRSRAAPPR